MAGRGRGATLPSWMTQAPGSGAPGFSTDAIDALAASNPNAASNPPANAEAGQPTRAISSTIKALHCVCLTSQSTHRSRVFVRRSRGCTSTSAAGAGCCHAAGNSFQQVYLQFLLSSNVHLHCCCILPHGHCSWTSVTDRLYMMLDCLIAAGMGLLLRILGLHRLLKTLLY